MKAEKILKGKRILVTGGAGFIGSHIVDRLIKLDAKVVVLDDLSTGKLENIAHNLNKIEFIQKDFSAEKTLEEVLAGVDFVFHQAALRCVPKSIEEPLRYHLVNATGTLNLFLKAKEKGVKKIVFASSSSVYGERVDFPEKESDSLKPLSPYAATKLIGERYGYLFSKAYNLDIVSLRYFNVFGPRQSLENQYAVVVPKFIVSLLKGERPPIYGDGNQERDFTYIDNVVDANILVLAKAGIAGEVFNIASGRPQSVNNLLKVLKEIMSKDIAPTFLKPRPGDVRKTHADTEKTKRLLDWKPKIDFKEGLKRTVEWFRTNYKSK